MNDMTVAWSEANQRYLVARLADIRTMLERGAEGERGAVESGARENPEISPASWSETVPGPALETLCSTFGLSAFERDILLLCAGIEFDSGFATLCAAAHGDPNSTYPTFGLALSVLREPHWSALAPDRPLRFWHLINVGSGSALTLSPLRIDERVLHYLAGIQYLDESLAGSVAPLSQSSDIVPSHRVLADRIARTWAQAGGAPPLMLLRGPESASKHAIAAQACADLGLIPYLMSADAISGVPADTEAFVRLWEREAALGGYALVFDCDLLDTADLTRWAPAVRLAERVRSPAIVTCREPFRASQRATVVLEVGKPTPAEQRTLWLGTLQPMALDSNGTLDALVTQFALGAPDIRAAGSDALARLGEVPAADPAALLWDSCRTQARPSLDALAQRIEPAASWEDLILPAPQKATLHEIAIQVRRRRTVYEAWGFATKGSRGLGISALFAGASGTGKTMAAEVLAGELRLDLYRIDLSGVVSKYIGETEKNLRRVFDAAEDSGAILLFDEADALFGKRSEVKDSHDRYANIEISYLLQRMEAYRGLAILTTNLRSALDAAFLRRIRFIVQFPFPDTAQRAQIWDRIFPTQTPCEGLDAAKLAQLNVPGGSIRNIALNAAFLAADGGEPVRMTHLLRAARGEYTKLERPLTEAEIGGWL